MCKERWRTRDLLLEYDKTLLPPRPYAAQIHLIYPWENTALSILTHQLFMIAQQSGFDKDEQDFLAHFGAYLQNRPVIFEHFSNFPEIGEIEKLYFDLDEKILYYWDTTEYIPVNAMLIANTTLEGGGA